MSIYADKLKAIRETRAARDEVRAELHEQLIEQLKLLRAQRKVESKEVAVDPATLDAIEALREQSNAASESLRAVEERLLAIAQLQSELESARAELAAFTNELEQLQKSLARVEAKLNDPTLTADEKASLEAERANLRTRTTALAERVAALKNLIASLQERLRDAKREQANLEEQRREIEKRIEAAQSELTVVAKSAKALDDQTKQLSLTRLRIDELRAVLAERERAVQLMIENLFLGVTPQTLIEEWDDAVPIMLLPLRLETRFKKIGGEQELWVRVFPDEIAVTSHEKILTDRERDAGVAYWKALADTTDDAKRKDAWRALADKFGANRAAWVALQTKPLNWTMPPPSSGDLKFSDIKVTKPDNWTEAPHSLVMPDRFVLMAYRGGNLVRTLVGEQIPDRLILGPAPLEDADKPSITRDPTDNRLTYGRDFLWLTEFPFAVQNGMGFRLSLDSFEWQNGFDQLLVIGLKLSSDDSDGQKLVEDLIDNHHYSAKGFSIVRQGSATNNTQGEESHYSSSDWMHDVSYFVETGKPLFSRESDPDKATDGQRLAEYLGINYEPLQYVSNADACDHAEAVAMNRALYASTLGYYLNSMLNEVMSDDAIQRLRVLFTDHVTGRGPIAAIRVGNQPYGILLTSNFPQWAYERSVILEPEALFDDQVRRVLMNLRELWQQFKSQLSHIGKAGNASDNLMKVLGLQPTSAEYYHRVGYSYDYLRNLEEFQLGGKYYSDVLMRMIESASGLEFLKRFGYKVLRDDGKEKPIPLLFQLIYQHYHTKLDNQNLIDGLPLSEERGIKPYDEGTGKNYIDWLVENSDDTDKLEHQDFGSGIKPPNALLYMMLHNALLLEIKHGIYRLLTSHDIVADELVRSRKFMNISTQPDISHWEVFRASANRVLPNESSNHPLLSFVQLNRFNADEEPDVALYLNQVKDALRTLSKLKTASLERLFAEHIDVLNYRLDAWQTALYERRLRATRNLNVDPEKRRKGIYVGSYGYLENVRATSQLVDLSETELPPELREGRGNLFHSPQNGGYVHTPSLNHATAAAILRNGYLTHSSPAERDKLSVNLSSERVRRAIYLIEGVRNGQSLEALLGYLFERGLHDWTTRPVNPVILDHLKPLFRQAFPIKRTKLPREGFDSEPAEVIEEFSVVNGLDLARTTSPFPYGITSMPPLGSEQVAAIQKEKDNLENTLDALRDLLTAECAYQLALGNFDRAAAVMQAISGGQLPVEIEVINSAHGSDLSFTNRVVIQFDAKLTKNPWPVISMTSRALTEPALNNWAGTLLGDPTTVKCTARAVDSDGHTLLDGAGNPIEGLVTLKDLGLQPLDFIHMIRKQVEATGHAELESRVRQHFAQKFSVSDATIVKIEFAEAGGATARSFAEILPFADAVREVLGKSRPLDARDFVSNSKTVAKPPENPGNIDVAELQARVASIRTDFDALFSALDNAANDAQTLQTETAVNLLRQRLVAIADAGFPLSFPLSASGFGEQERTSLLAQVQSLHLRYEDVKKGYDEKLKTVQDAATMPPRKVSLLVEMAKGFFGDDFVLLPKFTLTDVADVLKADAAREQLLKYARNTKLMPLPVEEWLHGVSLVRPNMHTFSILLMLNETFNQESLPCSPLQLPFRDKDSWLGVEFPEGTAVVHDTLAIMQCLPQGFQPTAAQAGLLVDEWTETLPQKDEVTGIAFNFDQPNSAPPSAVLLAVTPEATGQWHWNSLAGTVLDTIERAKLRAVEPDVIETLDGFGTLLPSTISEFNTSGTGISLDYLLSLNSIASVVASLSHSLKR